MTPAGGRRQAAGGRTRAWVQNLVCLPILVLAVACTSVPDKAAAPSGSPAAAASEAAGTSCDNAIVIHASGEGAGIKAENEWIRAHFGPFTKGPQSLLVCNKKHVDKIDFTTADGKTHSVFFDISEWFGKF